jgi:glutamine synthetase type III
MPADRFCVRGLLFVACVAAGLTLWPATSRAYTEEDQRRLCTPDVFRLCSGEIPDRERIIACMRRQRASLSPECRSVFGKPAQSASATR